MSINLISAFRPRGATAVLGDSRPAQIFSSPSNNYSVSGYNHFSWGNARAGHRLKVVYNGGVSGDRTDQMLARVAAATSALTGAGHLFIKAAVNDIAQSTVGYTTVNTVGPNQGVAVTTANVAAVAFANIQFSTQQFLRQGGQIVTIELECGAENYSAANIASCIDLNEQLRELAEVTPGVVLFDAWKEMHDPALSSTTTIRFKANYAQEASGSGVHESNLGGYKLGVPFAAHIIANFAAVPYLPANVNEIPSISPRNQLTNPLFVTTGGGAGSGSNGITGTVPGGWTADRTGGGSTQTAVISTGAPADGSPGNECIVACTFGGAGDIIRLKQDATIGNLSIGDIIEGVASIVIDAGASSLAGVYMELQYNDGSTTTALRDLTPLNNNIIGTDGYTAYLRTPAYQIAAKAGGAFCTMRLHAQGSGAGTATVRWRQVQIRKRAAL